MRQVQVKIERFDDLGRGIGYINNKVTFIDKVVPEDIVEVELTKEKKKYNEAKLIKIIKQSPLRIDAKCPYFSKCGGCQLQNISYKDTIKYKKEKIVNIFSQHKIHRRSHVQLAGRPDLSFVILHNLLHNGQPDAASAL